MTTKDDLAEALTSLGPIKFADVPQQKIDSFIEDAVKDAEILVNSIPQPPSTGDESSFFDASKLPAVNSAKSASETLLDPSDLPETVFTQNNPETSKAWGKPVKVSAKENPLRVAIYKMAAKDRHGAWFARRSVHAGLGFTRWQRAMQREFLESLHVNKGPGQGAVRGIAADKRIEHFTSDDKGSLTVWQLSSAFPGPVTPREFVSLHIVSDACSSESSNFVGVEQKPRTMFVISRPATHDKTHPRQGLVMGQYESIEMIREVPVKGAEAEQNPVEWIMITRSDPGGGIPKFMVERGTPGSIVADVPKWLDWAISKGDISDEDLQVDQSELEKKQAEEPPVQPPPADDETSQGRFSLPTVAGVTGVLSSAVHSVEGYLPSYFRQDVDDSASVSSASTQDSFQSASDHRTSEDSAHVALAKEIEARGPQNNHEKELLKIQARREALDVKIAESRAADDKRSEQASEKEESERKKLEEKLEKDRQRQEENYRKQLEKIDARQKKEAAKVEERRRKAEAKDVLLSARRERDEYKEKLSVAEQEIKLLRAEVDKLTKEKVSLSVRPSTESPR